MWCQAALVRARSWRFLNQMGLPWQLHTEFQAAFRRIRLWIWIASIVSQFYRAVYEQSPAQLAFDGPGQLSMADVHGG